MSPRPQVDHIRRPQSLEAAAEVLGERGIGATRISDIAERAGTSVGAVLYWFASKDDLLAQALSFEDDRFYAELVELLAGEHSPSERLAVLIECSSAGGEWKLWMEFWTRALRDSDAGIARRQLDQRWRGQIERIVGDGQANGEFASGDSGEIAATLAALLDGLAVQMTLADPEMPSERMSKLARTVAEGLLGCTLPAAPVAVAA